MILLKFPPLGLTHKWSSQNVERVISKNMIVFKYLKCLSSYNGDLLPDLFGTQTDENQTRAFWIGAASKNG